MWNQTMTTHSRYGCPGVSIWAAKASKRPAGRRGSSRPGMRLGGDGVLEEAERNGVRDLDGVSALRDELARIAATQVHGGEVESDAAECLHEPALGRGQRRLGWFVPSVH